MKKTAILLILCITVLLCACGSEEENYYPKEKQITAFVEKHKEELMEQIEDTGPDNPIKEFKGIHDVIDRRFICNDDKYADLGMFCGEVYGNIYYEYSSSGILTSSRQMGFYYSVTGSPSIGSGPTWAAALDTYNWDEVETEDENVLHYKKGDDFYITKKICDHFYYVYVGN